MALMDPSRRSSLGNHQEVRAGTDQRRLGFRRPGGEEDRVALSSVLPLLEEVVEPSGDTFDADDFDAVQPRLRRLVGKLSGVMEVGGGEPVRHSIRVAVLTVS